MGAEIFAIDEPESTVYVLIRDGQEPVMADWPQPLRELCPEAVMAGTLGSEDWHKASVLKPEGTHGVDGNALGATSTWSRRSLVTGTTVTLWRDDLKAWPNMNGSKYVVECVDHRNAVGFRTSAMARRSMKDVVEWCPDCIPLVRGIGVSDGDGDTTAIEVLSKLEALYGPNGGKEK